jgi:hypothetical protein
MVDMAIDLRDESQRYLRQAVGEQSSIEDARSGLLRLAVQYQQRLTAAAEAGAAGNSPARRAS